MKQSKVNRFPDFFIVGAPRCGMTARCPESHLFFYSEVAKYRAQIERLFELAGHAQTHVIMFDNVVSDSPGVYQRMLKFLGADNDVQTEFERRYQSQMYPG